MPFLNINYNLFNKQLFIENNFNELKIKNDLSLKYATKQLIRQLMNDCNEKSDQNIKTIEVIEGNSDLIVNEYEGGFKVWEGLEDIIDYFIQYNVLNHFSNHQNLNVLEVFDLLFLIY